MEVLKSGKRKTKETEEGLESIKLVTEQVKTFEPYMQRAIDLAEQARGKTSPNPMVGAVIIKGGRIVGEGFHEKAGQPHAEINALKEAGTEARGSTMVITLEPCNHYGRTPPCTAALVEAGVSRVIVGLMDPNPVTGGSGVKTLREAGIAVETSLLAEVIAKQNEAYVKYITTRRPFVLLKAGLSLDGKIAASPGVRTQLTGKHAQERVHSLRCEYDAILVGIGTVRADDPLLNVRFCEGTNPIRIVVDETASLPLDSQIVQTAKEMRTILAVGRSANIERLTKLQANGVEVLEVSEKDSLLDLGALLDKLGQFEITSVLLEGGSGLMGTAVSQGLVDKYSLFMSPKLVGKQGLDLVGKQMAEPVNLRIDRTELIGDDLLIAAYPADPVATEVMGA